MQNFRNLKVWAGVHQLALDVYRSTAAFPRQELYGLTSQLRRAGASIGANIAEGCGRRGKPDLCRFLQIAMGSASELEYHFLLAHDLGMLKDLDYRRLDAEVVGLKRMLSSLITSLRGQGRIPDKAEVTSD